MSWHGIQFLNSLAKEDNLCEQYFSRTCNRNSDRKSTDIKQMYQMIWIDPTQCDYQRILWHFSHHKEIEEYRLVTVTNGLNFAPYLALLLSQQLYSDEGNNYPPLSSFWVKIWIPQRIIFLYCKCSWWMLLYKMHLVIRICSCLWSIQFYSSSHCLN